MNTQQAFELNFRQIANVLRRRWRMIVKVGLIVAVAVSIVGLIVSPRYTAKAQIVVDPQRGNVRPVAAGVLDEAAVETHVAMLLSDNHLKRVFDSLVSQPGTAGDMEGERPLAIGSLELEHLRRHIKAFKEQRSRVVGIAYTSTSPELAAAIVNRTVKLYVAGLIERNRADPSENLSSLNERIRLLGAEVDRAQAALWDYRTSHGLTAGSRANIVDQQLVDFGRELVAARADLAAQQARLATVRDLQQREDGIASLIDALNDANLKALHREQQALLRSEGQLKLHPASQLQELRKRIDESVYQSVHRLANDRDALETRVRNLQDRIASLKETSADVRKPEARLHELQSEVTAFTQIQDKLLQRQRAMLEEIDVRVLSFADIPDRPSSLSPILFILPALVLASIGAGLVAVQLEQLDRGLRSEQDVSDNLEISCLGLVPRLASGQESPDLARRLIQLTNRWAGPRAAPATAFFESLLPKRPAEASGSDSDSAEAEKRSPHQYLLQEPFAPFTEAVRSIVSAALQLTEPQRASKVFLVTSSVPDEGKTTLALSFAVYAGLLKRRVLLIDLDLRRAAISCALGGGLESGGFEVKYQRPDDMIRTIPELGLDYLPLACNFADPVAFVENEQIPELLRRLKDSYECVVIDSAPLLGATETRLLAGMVDKVLFAIKWGSTRPELAQNALRLLNRRDLRDLVSAVITQVDLKQHALYGYGDFAESLALVKSNSSLKMRVWQRQPVDLRPEGSG